MDSKPYINPDAYICYEDSGHKYNILCDVYRTAVYG